MSLSKACLTQHAKENAITKKWLLRGLLIAAGAHLSLIPLMALMPKDAISSPERIALVVTGPTKPTETAPTEIEPTGTEPIETLESIEETLSEESVDALTEAVAQAELAATAQISSGAPPPPIASFQPLLPANSPLTNSAEPDLFNPKPIDDSIEETEIPEADSAAGVEASDTSESDSVADEPEESDSDTELDSVETAVNTTGESENADAEPPDLEALRQRLARRRTRQEGASTEITGEGSTPAVPTGSRTEAARRDSPSGEAGTGIGEGNGDGESSGPNTVSCRQCDRPDYPEEALADGVEGSPSVSLEYDEEGNVVGAVLEESSGNAALDQAALEAARSYELDSGGQSGSVSVEIDFGIEGSERSRAAQRRGERDSVSTPAPTAAQPQRDEVVQDPVPVASPSEPIEEPSSPLPEVVSPTTSEPGPSKPPADEERSTPEPVSDPTPVDDASIPLTPSPAPADNTPPVEPDIPDIAPPEPAPLSPEPAVPPLSPEPVAPPLPPPEPVAPPP
ncbi:MAG: TonB family protein, partial [Cyanobacteria bacterium J06649_5]